MAAYKVPQDVEAEDKLIGPFSFRQFVYLIVAALGIAAAWGLSRITLALLFVPLPIVFLFGILALPLRKDQPMETYLVAVIRFMFKPRLRLWNPDGSVAMVTVAAPKELEEVRTKTVGGEAARSQLGYLAQLMDSRGWAAKGVLSPAATAQIDTITISAADVSTDMLDSSNSVAQSFDNLINKEDTTRRQELMDRLRQQQQAASQATAAAPASEPTAQPHFNPYPQAIHQQVVNPLSQATAVDDQAATTPSPTTPAAQPAQQPQPAVTSQPSPDIMKLVTEGQNLSVSTLASEARRLQQKSSDDGEVVISLR